MPAGGQGLRHSRPRGGNRGSGTHPDRKGQGQRRAARRAARRPSRRTVSKSWSPAPVSTPPQIDDVIAGARHPGRRPSRQHRAQCTCWPPPDSPKPCQAPPSTVSAAAASRQISFAAQGVIAGRVRHCGRRGRGGRCRRAPMGSSVLPGSDPSAQMAQRYPERPSNAGHQRRTLSRPSGASRGSSSTSSPRRKSRKGRSGNQRGPVRQ